VTSETKFFAILFQGNSHRALLEFRGSIAATGRAIFLHVRTARPVQKMHRVKIREREKYDTPPAAQQRNYLLKKEKPGEAGL
jgi:hypothetical protein